MLLQLDKRNKAAMKQEKESRNKAFQKDSAV